MCGANEEDFHFTGVNWGRDLPEPVVADIRNVVAGDPSPDGKGVLAIQRGIEVGHVFAGLPYAETMKLAYVDENGKSAPMVMGCYGIGVTRLLGAAIEQNHDDKGIIWPDAIAPFTVAICPVGYKQSDAVRQAADQLYEDLRAAGIDVILDDRGERPGAMFADWELIGVPHRITVGERQRLCEHGVALVGCPGAIGAEDEFGFVVGHGPVPCLGNSMIFGSDALRASTPRSWILARERRDITCRPARRTTPCGTRCWRSRWRSRVRHCRVRDADVVGTRLRELDQRIRHAPHHLQVAGSDTGGKRIDVAEIVGGLPVVDVRHRAGAHALAGLDAIARSAFRRSAPLPVLLAKAGAPAGPV